MKLKYLFILCVFAFFQGNAQQIKRQTFCSVGGNGIVPIGAQKIIIGYTMGQCPGCNTISNGANTIRQGFQQPVSVLGKDKDTTTTGGGGPINPVDCVFKMAFSQTSKTDACGTFFDFEYEGDVLAGMKFDWDFGADGVPQKSTLQNPTKVAFANAGSQLVKLVVTNKTCPQSKSSIINVATKGFVAQSKVTDINCYGSKTGFITLATSGGSGQVNFSWSNGASTKDISNLAAGVYTYTAKDAKGCESKASVTVKQPTDSISVAKTTKDESCVSDKDGEITLTIKGGTAPYEFLWNDKATTKDRENLEKGLYVVTISDKNKCQTGAVVNLKRYCEKDEDEFINTFSPNDDGINDTWFFDGIDNFPKNVVEIFNRWGSVVYNKAGMKNGDWYGQTNDGKELPSGPYYYLIKLNDRDLTVFAGAVTIIR